VCELYFKDRVNFMFEDPMVAVSDRSDHISSLCSVVCRVTADRMNWLGIKFSGSYNSSKICRNCGLSM